MFRAWLFPLSWVRFLFYRRTKLCKVLNNLQGVQCLRSWAGRRIAEVAGWLLGVSLFKWVMCIVYHCPCPWVGQQLGPDTYSLPRWDELTNTSRAHRQLWLCPWSWSPHLHLLPSPSFHALNPWPPCADWDGSPQSC